MATGSGTGTPVSVPVSGRYLSAPSVLTDAIFTAYGGYTGTSTAAQRTAAYATAEGKAAEEIGTFVTPTIVTGTYQWPPMGQMVNLRYDFVSRIISLTSIHEAGCECADTVVELTGCAWITDYDNSIVDVREVGNTVRASCASCSCRGSPWGYGVPYQFRVIYEAGLPDEASSDPRLLTGLTGFANLALQQMIDPSGAEGGPGDPGVQSFRAGGYGETRTKLRKTSMGSSAVANYAANMLREFKAMGALKLGW
jgi:hypothetical protein